MNNKNKLQILAPEFLAKISGGTDVTTGVGRDSNGNAAASVIVTTDNGNSVGGTINVDRNGRPGYWVSSTYHFN